MKIVIDVNGNPKKDDLLIYNGTSYDVISKASLLKDTNSAVKSIAIDLEKFKSEVNNKLKDYHEVLQMLTKGE